MGAPETPQAHPRRYELALRAGQGLVFSFRDHGVVLSDERLDWMIGERPDAARLDSVVEVHLQTGGSWTSPIARCRLTFKDGFTLTVMDSDKAGFKDDERAATYRAFVRDLHARLVAQKTAARFTSGYTRTQFHVVALAALCLAAIGIGI